MMKRLILTFMAVCMSLVAAAQPAKEDIIKEIVETGSSMKSLQCSFIQTRKMSIMSTEAVSEGTMHYQQPDKLRWEYVAPYKNVFVLNGTEALMQNETRSDVVDIEQNRRFKGIARLMTGSISGSFLSDDKSFDVSVEETPQEWVVTLVPLRREMKQMWTRIVMHFDRSQKHVSSIGLYEPSGDCTEITFNKVVKNGAIAPETFNIR